MEAPVTSSIDEKSGERDEKRPPGDELLTREPSDDSTVKKASELIRLIRLTSVVILFLLVVLSQISKGPVLDAYGKSIALGLAFVGVICLCMYFVRASFSRTVLDSPLCMAGAALSVLAGGVPLCMVLDIIRPSYALTAVYFGGLVNLELQLHVACVGKNARPRLAALQALLTLLIFWLPTCLAPESWAGQHGHSGAPKVDYFMQGILYFSSPSSWAAYGRLAPLLSLWFTVCSFTWVSTVFLLRYIALTDFRGRVELRPLHAVINGIITIRFLLPGVSLFADFLTGKSWYIYDILFEFGVSPLAMLVLIDATYEFERKERSQLAEAARALQHAEEVLAARRSFLRYVFHELRVPMNTLALGIENVNETLAGLGKLIPPPSPRKAATADDDVRDGVIADTSPGSAALSSAAGGSSLILSPTSALSARSLLALGQDTVGIMATAAGAAKHTIDSTLQVEKIDAGEYEVELRPTDVRALVTETCGSLALLAQQGGISFRLSIDLPPQMAAAAEVVKADDDCREEDTADGVIADSERTFLLDGPKIAQVLRNLLSNSLKFTPSKGAVSVMVKCTTDSLKEGNDSCNLGSIIFTGTSDLHAANLTPDECEALLGFRGDSKVKYRLSVPSGLRPTGRMVTVTVTVTDSGCGMTSEELGRLFQPFVQIEAGSRQKGGGTGLGLYLSRMIVEAHGGRLSATSEGPGKGTIFTFTLPLRAFVTTKAKAEALTTIISPPLLLPEEGHSSDHEPHPPPCNSFSASTTDVTTEPHSEVDRTSHGEVDRTSDSPRSLPAMPAALSAVSTAPPSLPPSLLPLRLLLVDDVKPNRVMLRRRLCQHLPSSEIVEAENGREAITVVQQAMQGDGGDGASRPFHAVLMDGAMPVLDGYQAARKLRQELLYGGVIIGVTGNALSDDQQEFIAAGADLVHVKPVDSKQLAADIVRYVAAAAAGEGKQ